MSHTVHFSALKFFLHIVQHVRSDHRVSHDPVPMVQAGLRALLSGSTGAAWSLNPNLLIRNPESVTTEPLLRKQKFPMKQVSLGPPG